MIDLAEIERLDFKEDASLARLDSLLGEVAGYAETRSAFEIATVLTRKSHGDTALERLLEPYLAKFRVLAFPLLNDDESVAVFDHIKAIISDERISLYERLRARMLVMPASRRATFASAALARVHSSAEPFGGDPSGGSVPSTVGAWVTAYDIAGSDPDTFFSSKAVAGLSEEQNHAVRHLIHSIGLLAAPGSVEARPIAVPAQAKPPTVPDDLPVAPVSPRMPPMSVPKIPAVPTVPPVRSIPRAQAVPLTPSPVQPPPPVASREPQPPRPATPPLIAPEAPKPIVGPSMASVIARLHQSQEPMPATPPTIAHLTPDDVHEIKGHEEKLTGLDAGPNVHDTLEITVEQIMKTFQLDFPDEHMRKRCSTILTARVKDIRNATDTLELLARPQKVGGLGLEPEIAEKIVIRATEEAQKFSTEHGVKQLEETQKRREAVEPAPAAPKVPTPEVISEPRVPQTPPQPRVAPTVVAPVKVPVREVREPITSIPPPPMPTASFRPVQTERPHVSDIRGATRLVGPIEELRGMTIADFRKLGNDSVGCIRRLYEKIQQLGHESFTTRSQGIKAWRESDTYRLYLVIGQESLVSGKTIRDVIDERQRAGKPFLSEQELTLIADLNHKLRY